MLKFTTDPSAAASSAKTTLAAAQSSRQSKRFSNSHQFFNKNSKGLTTSPSTPEFSRAHLYDSCHPVAYTEDTRGVILQHEQIRNSKSAGRIVADNCAYRSGDELSGGGNCGNFYENSFGGVNFVANDPSAGIYHEIGTPTSQEVPLSPSTDEGFATPTLKVPFSQFIQVGRSPIHVAAQNNHLDVLRTLILPGHDWLSSVDALGCTPLHLAAVHGHLEAAKLLIKEGCPVNFKNQFGNTALHEACYRGNAKVVKYLLQRKADRIIQNQDGNQCLHLACQSGHAEVIKLLLKAGADPNSKNLIGDSCIHVCVRYNQFASYRLLSTSAYCKFEEPNSERNTPLHIAVQYNRQEFAHALLDLGVNPNSVRNLQGETALDIANRLGYDDLLSVSSSIFPVCGGHQGSNNHESLDQPKQSSSHDSSAGVPHPQPPSGATSGMKNLFRAATGRSSSGKQVQPSVVQFNPPSQGGANGNAIGHESRDLPSIPSGATAPDTNNTPYDAGRNTRSRSRGGPQKTPPQPRKRNTSEGNALEHENSPAVGGELSQELSLEIEDDATKPVSATGSNVLQELGANQQNTPGSVVDNGGITYEENLENVGGAEYDLIRRHHQRRSHKSKGKVPRKYVYERGVYRKSKRLGTSMSSLSTIEHQGHHHHHQSSSRDHPSSRDRGGGGADNHASSKQTSSHRHPKEGGGGGVLRHESSRHHHHQRGTSQGAGGTAQGGLFTLYDGDYLTKPAKESTTRDRSAEQQQRRHRTARNFENEDFSEHRGQSISHIMSKCRCGCAKQIAALDAKVEFLKEAILDELKLSEEVTDEKIVALDEKTTHQVACVDKLCRERISAERAECNHRIDKRALQERIVYSKELKRLETRMESTMKSWCEARYRRVNEKIGNQMALYPGTSPSDSMHKRRHSCSDVDPRNLVVHHQQDAESGAETTNSSKSGYRDSGAFEAHSKTSSQDYPILGSLNATTSGGESLGTTPSDHSGGVIGGHFTRSKHFSTNIHESQFLAGFLPIDERVPSNNKFPNVFAHPSDDSESLVDNESVSHLPILHGLPSDSMKNSDFASLAIPPLFSKDSKTCDNKRSISAHSDETKIASDEIMSNLQQNFGPGLFQKEKGSSQFIKPPTYLRAASTSTSATTQGTKMSMSPLTAPRSQVRYSSISGTAPSYQEVSAQLKAIQQQAARSKTTRNSSLSGDDRKSHDSSGSATGSVHEGRPGSGQNNDLSLGLNTPVGSYDEKSGRQVTEAEINMRRQYEKDQQALKQRIKNLEQMLRSYQNVPGQNESPLSSENATASTAKAQNNN